MQRYVLLLLLAFSLLSFFSWTARVEAQTTPIDLSLTPPTHYLHVIPGKTATHTVTIQQHGSLPLEVTPSVVDFTSDGETGQPQVQMKKPTSFDHITLQNSDIQLGQAFLLNPGQKKQITFRFSPPNDSPQREYPLTLLFIAKPNQATTIGTGSQVSGIIGSNVIVFISPSSEDKGKLSLKEIQVPRLVDSFGALTFSLLAENSGRNATTASGSAQVKNWRDETVAEYSFYPDMILAHSTRLLRTGASLEPDATSPIHSTFRYKPTFLLGLYTISAQLAETGQADDFRASATQTVFALPFSLIALLLLGSVLYAGYKYLIQRQNKVQ